MAQFQAEDVQAVNNLMADYSHGCDNKDMDLVMSIWSKDPRVVWEHIGWDLRGKEEIRKAFKESLDAWSRTRHMSYNEKIEVTGDTAEAWHYGDWRGDDANGTTWFVEGKYHRKFVKEEGAWKMSYQEITQEPMALESPLKPIQEIKNVIADYCKGFDEDDIELYLSTYADDVHVYLKDAGKNLHGKEAVKQTYLEDKGSWSNSRHKIYNFHVRVNGNKAVSHHCVDWHATDKNGITHFLEGRYYREFEKVEGAWKIKYQETTQDFFVPFPAWPKV